MSRIIDKDIEAELFAAFRPIVVKYELAIAILVAPGEGGFVRLFSNMSEDHAMEYVRHFAETATKDQ